MDEKKSVSDDYLKSPIEGMSLSELTNYLKEFTTPSYFYARLWKIVKEEKKLLTPPSENDKPDNIYRRREIEALYSMLSNAPKESTHLICRTLNPTLSPLMLNDCRYFANDDDLYNLCLIIIKHTKTHYQNNCNSSDKTELISKIEILIKEVEENTTLIYRHQAHMNKLKDLLIQNLTDQLKTKSENTANLRKYSNNNGQNLAETAINNMNTIFSNPSSRSNSPRKSRTSTPYSSHQNSPREEGAFSAGGRQLQLLPLPKSTIEELQQANKGVDKQLSESSGMTNSNG